MAQQSVIWNRSEIVAALHSATVFGEDFAGTGVSIDTRTLQEGDIFVALTGDHSNGHDYVRIAQDRGAAALIISEPDRAQTVTIPCILVENCEQSLRDLASFRRKQTRASVIAITGSVGKTSTKEALRFVLQEFGKTYATDGNYNNHIGVPLCMARMSKDCDYAIFEIGTSNPGEISPLSQLVQPDLAIITAVGAAHLQNFENIAAIAREKLSIIDGLKESGILFFNGITCPNSYQNCGRVSVNYMRQYSDLDEENQNQANLNLVFERVRLDFAKVANSFVTCQIFYALLELSNFYNLEQNRVIELLQNYQPPRGRGRHYTIVLPPKENQAEPREFLLIDDAYNANPMSTKASLEFANHFAKLHQRNLVLVLGDMLELGKDSQNLHLELKDYIDPQQTIALLTTGSQMQILNDCDFGNLKARNFSDISQLQKKLFDTVDKNCVLLIKGSHGTGLYRIVDELLNFEVNS